MKFPKKLTKAATATAATNVHSWQIAWDSQYTRLTHNDAKVLPSLQEERAVNICSTAALVVGGCVGDALHAHSDWGGWSGNE